MEIKGRIHCFFEQSGIFKNAFKSLEYDALDYDIQNHFGETDIIVDLFEAIENAYEDKPSILDEIDKEDLTIAFFPCIYFSANNSYIFDGTWNTFKQKRMTNREINQFILDRSKERQKFYEIAIKMFCVFYDRGLRLIVENPYTNPHYLTSNFPYKPAFVDRNRKLRGDYFTKPTQYWFINCNPTNGQSYVEKQKPHKTIFGISGHKGNMCDEDRSLISPEYAMNFICDFILGKEQQHTLRRLF